MEKQITIIIPTYNMENYIAKCLDSLLIPQLDQIEVLVVNDGSKDRSSEIAHQYQDKYPESIRVIDKENGNYGSCINTALPQAKGRYIKILDADDSFDTSEFSKFVDLLKIADEDVVISSFDTVNPDGQVIRSSRMSDYGDEIDKNTIYHSDEIFKTYLRKFTAMHRIAYNRRIFSRINYHQTEGISYTDIEWATVPMSVCETIRFSDLIVYKYLEGREGQTVSLTQVLKSFNSLSKVGSSLLREYKSALSELASDYILSHAVDYHISFYNELVKNSTADLMTSLRVYDENLKITFPEAYKAIGEVEYSEYIKFCKFKDIRKKNYPVNYKVPFIEKGKLSISLRLNRMLGYSYPKIKL